MKQSTKTITQLFQKSKSIALFGHINPDGDCIGSMLGLGRLLEKQDKKVSYFTPTPVSRMYDFLPNVSKIKTKFDYKNYDLLVFVDFSSYGRITPFTEDIRYFDTKNIIIFDHHPENTPAHSLSYKDTQVASSAEVILEYSAKPRKKYFDKEIATYLYMGLATDSGNFLFDTDPKRTFSNAGKLIKLGADKALINNNIFRKKSVNQIKFLGLLIQRIQIQGDVLCSYYESKDLQKYAIDQEEASYGLTVIQNIDGPKVTLLAKKIEATIRCSLRAKDTIIKGKKSSSINCNEIAKYFGGGGHPGAAGFTVPVKGDFLQQIRKITQQINKEIKK